MDTEEEQLRLTPVPEELTHSDFRALEERQDTFGTSPSWTIRFSNEHTELLETRSSVYWERQMHQQIIV